MSNPEEKLYSYRKCRKILRQVYNAYRRKKNKLLDIQKKRFENILTSLQTALKKEDKLAATRAAKNLEKLTEQHLKKNIFDQLIDVVGALAFALAIAIIVRQMWFEFHTVPTGSMRPTIKENDGVMVLKDDFCLNIPLTTSHFYFNPSLLKRGNIVIFTSKDLNLPDTSTMYFYLIPGKKQFIKRLIGKPGDSLYFYGGKIYGTDSNGNEIKEFADEPWFTEIEHIPFIKFEGRVETPVRTTQGIYPIAKFYQMNHLLAEMQINQLGQVQHELKTDNSDLFFNKGYIKHYYDIWGFKNYAMARLLTKDELIKYSGEVVKDIKNAPLYLEISHHPCLDSNRIITDQYGRIRPALNYSTSIVPLNEETLKTIFNNLYTSRFIVKNGYARSYGNNSKNTLFLPKFNHIPDGTYEFINGEAYQVKFSGITVKLSKEHPIYDFSIENTQKFFNLGIEFNTLVSPNKKNQLFIPSRYAYFRDKNLYLMGKEILKKNDPVLVEFMQTEYAKQSNSSPSNPYFPFEDLRAPIKKNGSLDKEFIRKYGITIPDKMYLVLGDNHANSADSREFGFVPQSNLRGGANLIFWPPQERFGKLYQPSYEKITQPKIVIWSAAFIVLIFSTYFIRKKTRRKLKF